MAARAEQTVVLHSDRVAARLALLTRDGRTPERVVEEALDRLPEPRRAVGSGDDYLARIAEIQEQARRDNIPSMAEFDAREYDAHAIRVDRRYVGAGRGNAGRRRLARDGGCPA